MIPPKERYLLLTKEPNTVSVISDINNTVIATVQV